MQSRGGRLASGSGGLGPHELDGWRCGEPATVACDGRWVAAAGILRFSNPLSKRHQDSVEEIGRQNGIGFASSISLNGARTPVALCW